MTRAPDTTTDIGTRARISEQLRLRDQQPRVKWSARLGHPRTQSVIPIYRSAYLYDHRTGVMTDLNQLIPQGSGWYLVDAFDINDAGQIVGRGLIGGEMHAFVLTPSLTRPSTRTDGSFILSAIEAHHGRFDFDHLARAVSTGSRRGCIRALLGALLGSLVARADLSAMQRDPTATTSTTNEPATVPLGSPCEVDAQCAIDHADALGFFHDRDRRCRRGEKS